MEQTAVAVLFDPMVSDHPDLFCLTETWFKNSTTCTYTLYSTSTTLFRAPLVFLLRAILLQSVVVLVFLYVNPSLSCLLLCPSFPHLNTPQLLSSCLSLKSFSQYLSSNLIIFLLYFFLFLDEFNSFLSVAATTPHEFVVSGDFNIHLDNPSDHATSQFLSVLLI